MPSTTADSSRSATSTPAAATEDGKRSPSGSNYGDFAPAQQQPNGDPFRGAELERDSLPANADFSGEHPNLAASPAGQDDAATREERVRRAAYERYQRRGGSDGDAVTDWLEAEAALEPAPLDTSPPMRAG